MVIHYLKDDCLAALKTNLKTTARFYELPTNDWIYDYFDGENPFGEFKTPVENFELLIHKDSDKSTGEIDLDNAIRLYSATEHITVTQAGDERLWAGLTHGDFWGYMHDRWADQPASNHRQEPHKSVLSRYFFTHTSSYRRAMFVNTLSRLWWVCKLTHDPEREDPFELTRYFSEGFSTKTMMIFSNTFTNSPQVCKGLVSALMTFEKSSYFKIKSYTEKSKTIILACRFLNVLGGISILDYFTEKEIKEKVLNYLLESDPSRSMMKILVDREVESRDNDLIIEDLDEESEVNPAVTSSQKIGIPEDTPQIKTEEIARSNVPLWLNFLDEIENMKLFHSYKPIILLAMLELGPVGLVSLDDVLNYFMAFYAQRFADGLIVETPNSSFVQHKGDYRKNMQEILNGPVDIFCKKGYIIYDENQATIAFNQEIAVHLMNRENLEILRRSCSRLLRDYYDRLSHQL